MERASFDALGAEPLRRPIIDHPLELALSWMSPTSEDPGPMVRWCEIVFSGAGDRQRGRGSLVPVIGGEGKVLWCR